jgi:hypothetical protein
MDPNSPPSLQPIVPQGPGNVLYGRFGNMAKMHWGKIAIIVAVVLIAWYFIRKRG